MILIHNIDVFNLRLTLYVSLSEQTSRFKYAIIPLFYFLLNVFKFRDYQ